MRAGAFAAAMTVVVGLLSGFARGDDGEGGAKAPAAEPGIEEVRAALSAYDEAMAAAGGADTVPVEQAVLAAGASGQRAALVEFLGHERFGPLVLHALCEPRPGVAEAAVLAAYRGWPAARRVETARTLASFGSEVTRAALREVAALPEVAGDEASSTLLRVALARAGDAKAVAAVRTDLASKDADVASRALLLAGDSRAPGEFLAAAAGLAGDARKPGQPLRSQWSETKKETSADGTVTETCVPVELATVGEVAVEAASRMCATTLPEWVAWWYEPEKGPRFPRGADAAKRLKAFVAADAKAAQAKAVRAHEAVAAVIAAVRTRSGGEGEWKFVSASFDGRWTVVGTLAGAESRATVDASGRVTLP